MPQKSTLSKALAVAFAVLTVSAIGGMISMMIVFEIQTNNLTMTELPTVPSTTLAPPPVMRLPRSLIPERYEIFLHPQFYSRIVEEVNVTTPNQTLFFNGNSTVYFRCHQATKHIFLHSFELSVSPPEVIDRDNNKKLSVLSHQQHDDESDFLEIEMEENLKTDGNYSLFLSFEGEISEYLQALYVSKYTETDLDFVNDTIQESARRLFPCFDEPDMKAVFQLTVIHRRGTEALSNTLKQSILILGSNWKYTQFFPTPKMSSYLLALTISEFKFTTSPENRTYARPEAIDAGHTRYAAEITAEILKFYEEHFDLQYGMEDLAQIALPDLEPLAMENWGLITYQEGALLYEEGVSSWLHKEVITTVIAHELWFGNQVTMKWWNEIWLNEGFATYMSYLAVDHAEPKFQIKMIMDDLHAAFEEDALLTSHPLSAPPNDVQTTGEILGMFDAISYSKGAMVLRMLAEYVKDKAFDDGIRVRHPCQTHENDAAILTNARNKESKPTVQEFMENWTTQIGYPVVTINTISGSINQKHFLYNSSAGSKFGFVLSFKMCSPNIFLGTDGMDELISKKGEWILVNINTTGYYRVNYNAENWDRLLWQLETNPSRIPLMNRAQLVDDAFNLARAKQVDVTLALKSTRFLRSETAYLPWESAIRNLEYFILMFDRSEVYGPMQLYLRHQVEELYNFFKNQTDDSTVPDDHSLQKKISRGPVDELLESKQSESTVLHKQCIFNQLIKAFFCLLFSIHTNLRSVIYCQAVAAGDREEWEFAWEKFLSSTDTSEKDQLRKALSCTKKTWLLNRYLSYTLDPDKIRLMDVTSTVNHIAQNAAGQALAWNFIRAHWDYLPHFCVFNHVNLCLQLIRFRDHTEMNGAYRATLQAIEQTQVNIQWVQENHDAVLEWFERETANLE
uniref:Aminopeptidase n=1 Tax=Poecilia latipinna TaxID=48699 RepID=A0A3B3UZ19_9TELE